MSSELDLSSVPSKPVHRQPVWQSRAVKIVSYSLILIGLGLMLMGVFSVLKEQITLLLYQPPAPEIVSLADNPLPAIIVETAAPIASPTPPPTSTAAPVAEDSTAQPLVILPDPPTPIPTPTVTPTPNPYPPATSFPVRIVAPAINLDAVVVENGWHQETVNGQAISVWDVPEYAAGWHKNSALPGHTGNIVLSGHHNILGEVFRFIVDLQPGDTITLYADDRPYDYVVQEKFILKDKGESDAVRQANAHWIGPFQDQRLTLVTCWPYTSNTHRVVVIAFPVTATTEN